MVLWRAGLRIGEALDLAETDLDGLGALSWYDGERAAAAARWEWIAGLGVSWSRGSRSEPAFPSVRRYA